MTETFIFSDRDLEAPKFSPLNCSVIKAEFRITSWKIKSYQVWRVLVFKIKQYLPLLLRIVQSYYKVSAVEEKLEVLC